MVVFALEAAEVSQDLGELTGNEAKVEASALGTCPNDRADLLAMVGHDSMTEALQSAK
jgi:hypothetical protein